jgi:predicted patatin/cPLA2 family phospholipase
MNKLNAPPGVQLQGKNPAAVIAAVRERAGQLGAGGSPADGRKLGLVVEGGAMRGVCSAGGVSALFQLGFTNVFDEVFATSAGAMNASFFLADQVKMGITIYFDNCTRRAFLNPLRFWKMLNVDYLFEHVLTTEKPLDVAKILASRTDFFVTVIDRSTGEGQLIDVKRSGLPLLQILKAATAVPVFYNRAIDLNGIPSIDGGLVNPVPIEAALERGCTDILVLLTRPANFRLDQPTPAQRRLFNLIAARSNPGLNETFRLSDERSHLVRDLTLGRAELPPNVNVAAICTDEPETVGRTTQDRAKLRQAAIDYARTTLRTFGSDAEPWI